MNWEQFRQLQRENRHLRSKLLQAEHERDRAEAQLKQAHARIEQQEARLQYLEMMVRSDSSTSSKPPSSDPVYKKKQRKKRKGRPKGKRGAKKGHQGSHRKFIPVEQVDEVIAHRPEQCGRCEALLPKQGGTIAQRAQQTDIPVMRAVVTEHQVLAVRCPCCGKDNRGQLPKQVHSACFGPRLHALVNVLSGSYRVSLGNIQRLLTEQYGIAISQGGLIRMHERAVKVLAAAVEDAQRHIQGGSVAFADETPFRCMDSRPYLWNLSNHEGSVFRILPGRSQTQAKQLLGDFEGLLHADQYGGYNVHPLGKRQLCWAHIDRKLKALLEENKNRKLLRKLRKAVGLLFVTGQAIRDGTLKKKDRRKVCAEHQARLLSLWQKAAACHCKHLRAIAKGLLKMKATWCRFVLIPGAEPTNNHAERALRHAVLWRKTSFCTQSQKGNRFLEVMFSVHHSCRLQKRSVFDFVTRSFEAYFQGRPQPLLTPVFS